MLRRTTYFLAAALLLCGCASSNLPEGLGIRLGYLMPGSGRTHYEPDYLFGAYYAKELAGKEGWSWEAGLDFASPEPEDGANEVGLMLFRADINTSLHEWAGRGLDLYLMWGGQLAVPASADSETSVMLTSGIGFRSKGRHWDFRFTGQGVPGGGNIDLLWLVTLGFFF